MRRKLLALCGLGLVYAAAAVPASAQASIGFVTPSDLGGRFWTGQVSGGGTLGFVEDPSGEGFDTGSLQFGAADHGAAAQLRYSDLAWAIKLSDLVALRYRALSGGKQCNQESPKKKNEPDRDRALIVALDVDSDADLVADDVLIFDPSVNADVVCGSWQTWDAKAGLWYSAEDKDGSKHAAPLSDYVAAHPDAAIVFGGIRVLAAPGTKAKTFVGNLDFLALEGPGFCSDDPPFCVGGPAVTYLFRPVPVIP